MVICNCKCNTCWIWMLYTEKHFWSLTVKSHMAFWFISSLKCLAYMLKVHFNFNKTPYRLSYTSLKIFPVASAMLSWCYSAYEIGNKRSWELESTLWWQQVKFGVLGMHYICICFSYFLHTVCCVAALQSWSTWCRSTRQPLQITGILLTCSSELVLMNTWLGSTRTSEFMDQSSSCSRYKWARWGLPWRNEQVL